MPEVTLTSVTKTYPSGAVGLRELSLHVAQGELLVLVGPSGCGKTTTLRLIAGLETPSSGTIRIDGRTMAGVPPAERDVGFVFQRPALYPHRTVCDNIGFSLQLRRRNRWLELFTRSGKHTARSDKERVNSTARMLGLDGVLDRFPAQLSGGQQQRVALGRALVKRPGILLLDEPLSNLDAGLRQELRRELHLLQRQHQATMVYVTHDPLEAMSLGDRIAVLNAGQLHQVGRPQELFDRPADRFVAQFIGLPQMNFLDGELRGIDGNLWFETNLGRLPLSAEQANKWALYAGKRLTLGVRPENVQLVANDAKDAWPMQVRLIESLGNEALATLALNGVEISVRLRDYCQRSATIDTIAVGSHVMVRLHIANSHLFDGVTGTRLASIPTG